MHEQLKWLIDWLMGWCFKPYWRYSSHFTTEDIHVVIDVFSYRIYSYVQCNLSSSIMFIKMNSSKRGFLSFMKTEVIQEKIRNVILLWNNASQGFWSVDLQKEWDEKIHTGMLRGNNAIYRHDTCKLSFTNCAINIWCQTYRTA